MSNIKNIITIILFISAFIVIYGPELKPKNARATQSIPQTACVWPGIYGQDKYGFSVSSPNVSCSSDNQCVVCFNKDTNAICYVFDPDRCNKK